VWQNSRKKIKGFTLLVHSSEKGKYIDEKPFFAEGEYENVTPCVKLNPTAPTG
jgi:hypothetical protein